MVERSYPVHFPLPDIVNRVRGVFKDGRTMPATQEVQSVVNEGAEYNSMRLYVRPEEGEKCDRQFMSLFRGNIGGTRREGRRYFRILQSIPVGYKLSEIFPNTDRALTEFEADPSSLLITKSEENIPLGQAVLVRRISPPNPNLVVSNNQSLKK